MHRRSLLAFVSCICAPSAANAAELYGDDLGTINFVAVDGERNDVQVSMSGDRLVISDSGGSIATPPISTLDDGPSNVCVASSANSASCLRPRDSNGRLSGKVQVILADGDDSGTVGSIGEAVRLTVAGLEGNDRLTGPAVGKDRLGGLGSRPRLEGGAGNDHLSGAAGADSLAGNEGADSLRGGADTDQVGPTSTSCPGLFAGDTVILDHGCPLRGRCD